MEGYVTYRYKDDCDKRHSVIAIEEDCFLVDDDVFVRTINPHKALMTVYPNLGFQFQCKYLSIVREGVEDGLY